MQLLKGLGFDIVRHALCLGIGVGQCVHNSNTVQLEMYRSILRICVCVCVVVRK